MSSVSRFIWMRCIGEVNSLKLKIKSDRRMDLSVIITEKHWIPTKISSLIIRIGQEPAKWKKGKMTTWPAVVGAARSADYQVVQTDFYEYIETIATKTDLRQQFNSWYDYQKNITSTNILDSFYAIEKGFTQNGVAPLDSYVVDDGWTNYSSFWEFNDKFPHQLYDSSAQVHQFGSNFGLWLGPRGGYGTEGQIASWIENNNLGSRNWNSGGDINVSDARYLNKLVTDVFLNYQEKFDINYWKLDGMLLNPSTTPSQYHVTGKDEYVFTETFERWTEYGGNDA